jgi:hypothetical protein
MRRSRNKWKGTAGKRAGTIRYQRKENRRVKKERDKYKRDARKARAELEKERRKNSAVIHNKEDLVYISLQLFLVAGIGFRAVSRVLKVLGDSLGLAKAPCAQTIINWVMRLSISRIRNAGRHAGTLIPGAPPSNGLVCIIDISIGLSGEKILGAIFLNANHHALNEGAPTLQDIVCAAVAVAESWTGETVAGFLQRMIALMGKPASYLKDGGSELGKAIKLLGERGIASPCIDDISHIIANLLKHEYQEHPMFEIFISACGKVSKKLKQTVLACLAPPKISSKARFMNLHRLVKWAEMLLKHSPKGRAPEGSLLAKLRAGFDRLPECKAFIKNFLRDANPLLACQKILKTKGLNRETYNECLAQLEAIPRHSPVRTGFEAWLEKHFLTAADLGLDKAGMPVSSDNIESLFGVVKRHGTGEIKDPFRMALRIPALCGTLTREDARNVLNVSVKEQEEITDSLPSLVKQRRLVLPNPGSLDKILPGGEKQTLELVPGSKNRSKNEINPDISYNCDKAAISLTSLGEQARSPPKMEVFEAAAIAA